MNYLVGERYAMTSDIVNRRHNCVDFSSVEFEPADSVCLVIAGKHSLISNLYTNTVMLYKQTQKILVQRQSHAICNLYIHNEFYI